MNGPTGRFCLEACSSCVSLPERRSNFAQQTDLRLLVNLLFFMLLRHYLPGPPVGVTLKRLHGLLDIVPTGTKYQVSP
jgi:hypothetical protein